MKYLRKLSLVGGIAGLMTILQGCTIEDASKALLIILALLLSGGSGGTDGGGTPEAEASIISRIDGIVINTSNGISIQSIPSTANVIIVACEDRTADVTSRLTTATFITGVTDTAISSAPVSTFTLEEITDSNFTIREVGANNPTDRLECSVVFI